MPMVRLLFAALMLAPVSAAAATFAFTVSPAGSRLVGNLDLTAVTNGSLSGDYDAGTNPTGTRTKPGLFGSFGSTENVPVPVELTPGFSGPIDSVPTGGFELQLNEAEGTVVLSGLSLDLLPGGPLVIPSEVTLEFSTFRTRSPDSLFIGGFPLTIPVGENRLTALAAVQAGSAAGVLTAAGVDLWDFSIVTALVVTGALEGALGATPLPPVPVPYTMSGRVRVGGETAEVTAASEFRFANSAPVGLDLPALPFGLPTILPAGGTANVVFDLALESLTAELTSTLSLAAPGRAIPEPGAALVWCGLLWGMLARRRRRQV